MTIQVGQKLICNGNPEGRVLFIHKRNEVPVMADVRLWSGLRHVGDVTVSIEGLIMENSQPNASKEAN
jgi:hypothetical protein